MKRFALPILALALTACGTPGSGFENPFTVPVTFTVNPSELTLAPGERSHVSVTARADGRDLGSPTLERVQTKGITGVPDDTGMTILVSEETPEGTYGLVLKGTAGRGGYGQTVLNLTVEVPDEEVVAP